MTNTVKVRNRTITWLQNFYAKHADGITFNVWVFAGLSTIPFLAKVLDDWHPYNIVIGTVGTALIAAHGYLLKIVKDKELSQLEYWMSKSKRYLWLLHSIRKLIQAKSKRLSDPNIDRTADLTSRSVTSSLQMLYEFYSHYSDGQSPIMFRVTFFVPTGQGNALEAYFWYYSDEERPSFLSDADYPKRLFDRNNSPSLVVRVWNSKKTEIQESPERINYQYTGQEKKIKSMVAYPVVAHNSAEVLGVICVCASESGFFRESDISTHEEYIHEFGVRIAMEMSRNTKK
jgi:hypothetical protein